MRGDFDLEVQIFSCCTRAQQFIPQEESIYCVMLRFLAMQEQIEQ